MAGTADATTQQTLSVAGAAQQTSANVQTVAAASEEMAASVQEIVHQVTQSALSQLGRRAGSAHRCHGSAFAGTAERISGPFR